MRKVITGEQLARRYDPDPFALPLWRAPVYRTPLGFVLVVQAARLIWRLIRLAGRHPVASSVIVLVAVIWRALGWPVLAALVLAAVGMLVTWWWFWPGSFCRCAGGPARSCWRGWVYRRRWAGVLTIAGAAAQYGGQTVLPVLGKVTATKFIDRVYVRLVSGQSTADLAGCTENLAHGFGAMLCRVRTVGSGMVVLEFIRRDALALAIPALPIPANPDLRALPVGKREDGARGCCGCTGPMS